LRRRHDAARRVQALQNTQEAGVLRRDKNWQNLDYKEAFTHAILSTNRCMILCTILFKRWLEIEFSTDVSLYLV
jgi:hypothetical protein